MREFSSKSLHNCALTSYCSNIARQYMNEETCSKTCASFLPACHQLQTCSGVCVSSLVPVLIYCWLNQKNLTCMSKVLFIKRIWLLILHNCLKPFARLSLQRLEFRRLYNNMLFYTSWNLFFCICYLCWFSYSDINGRFISLPSSWHLQTFLLMFLQLLWLIYGIRLTLICDFCM